MSESIRFAAWAACWAVLSAQAAVLHVPADYPTVQSAIDAAAAGDRIIVAAGVYRENLTIDEKPIDLSSESGPAATILDGGARYASVVTITNYETGSAVRIAGFAIRRGYATGRVGGGGVSQLGGQLTLEDDAIAGNQARGYDQACLGGGVYLYGDATVRHTRIAGNYAACQGGGVYVAAAGRDPILIADNLIERNWAGNSGGGQAGGLYIGAEATLVRNVVRDNEATDGPGGVTAFARVHAADNAIYGNVGTFVGGVVAAVEDGQPGGAWVNNTIAGNTGSEASQVSVGSYGDDMLFANNAIVSTDGTVALRCIKFSGAGSPIFKGNDVYAGGNKPALGTCAQSATHGSNRHVDPQFVAGANGHPYHLAPGSPLIDAGLNRYAARIGHDLGGRPRILDGGHGLVVDIGAIEFDPAAP